MNFIGNNQNLTAASGILNIPFLENVYESFMDEALLRLGSRGQNGGVVFHLEPEREEDVTTQSLPAAQQYNPFFGRTPVPQANTRNPGVRITPRDVRYHAHIKIGPIKLDNDVMGIGELNDNQAMITVVIEALPHIEEALHVSIEGRRYSVENTRPIGFSQRRYLMVLLQEIQQTDAPDPDITIG